MNVTIGKIIGVAVILGVLGLLLEVVVKDDKSSASEPQSVARTQTASDSSTDSDAQRPFNLFPTTSQMTAPDFTLKSADGRSITLSRAVKSGPVLIDFWASYCGPCRMELPVYESIYKKYKAKGVQFYTINSYDRAQDIKTIAKATGLTMPMLVDEQGAVTTAYQVDAIPVTLVISKDQKCVAGSIGYDPGMGEDLPPTLDKLVAQGHS